MWSRFSIDIIKNCLWAFLDDRDVIHSCQLNKSCYYFDSDKIKWLSLYPLKSTLLITQIKSTCCIVKNVKFILPCSSIERLIQLSSQLLNITSASQFNTILPVSTTTFITDIFPNYIFSSLKTSIHHETPNRLVLNPDVRIKHIYLYYLPYIPFDLSNIKHVETLLIGTESQNQAVFKLMSFPQRIDTLYLGWKFGTLINDGLDEEKVINLLSTITRELSIRIDSRIELMKWSQKYGTLLPTFIPHLNDIMYPSNSHRIPITSDNIRHVKHILKTIRFTSKCEILQNYFQCNHEILESISIWSTSSIKILLSILEECREYINLSNELWVLSQVLEARETVK